MRLVVHLDGRTASGSATRGLRRRRAHPGGPGRRRRPRRPAGPDVAGARRRRQRRARPTGVDLATAGATPADRAEVVRGFVDGAGGLETAGLLPHQPLDRRASPARPGSPSPARPWSAASPGSPATDGADGLARHAPLSIAELDGARPRRAGRGEGPRLDRPRGAARRAATRSCSSRPPWPTSSATWPRTRFNGKAVNERTSFVRARRGRSSTRRCRSWTTRSRVGLGYDAEGTPRRRLPLVESGRTVARHPRPAFGRRGRRREHRSPRRGGLLVRTGRPPPRPAADRPRGRRRRGRRPGRRLLGRRAGRRRRARDPGLGLLVHPRPRPAHASP